MGRLATPERAAGPSAVAGAGATGRARLAVLAGRGVSALSRSLGLGSGSVIGGHVALAIEPRLVEVLATGRAVAVVSGTNGKTTTTRLLAEALGAGRDGAGPRPVAWSAAGANMPAGIVAALAAAPADAPAVLEVDEAYLPAVLRAAGPLVAVLLNLSRDQLDRVSEVRLLAARWGEALADYPGTVVANADDPLVVWAARRAPHAVYVAAGGSWHADAHHCPACDASIEFAGATWRCPRCGLARPPTAVGLVGSDLAFEDGTALRLELALPGRFNRANAAMAVAAAAVLGVPADRALAALSSLSEVAGRFSLLQAGGATFRLLLAKNPAGWDELLGLLAEGRGPLVVAINARLADGHDPSWLWDVPMERLAARHVVASGERCADLALRLSHAGVAHDVVADPLDALALAGAVAGAGGGTAGAVDVVGNYTAFQDLRRLGGRARRDLGVARRAAGDALPGANPAARRPARPVARVAAPGAAAGGPSRGTGGESVLRVVVVHPDLLGTYGDGGNGLVLADRALWRDIRVELVLAESDRPLPESGDLYCLGGGEDGPQLRSAELLRSGALARAVDAGATLLAVCAGFQIAGASFPGPDGALPGLGLIDATTTRSARPRAVGEVLARPSATGRDLAGAGLLTGFENHASTTAIGPGVSPLATVAHGVGNDGSGSEGAVVGRVVGTYLHGPVLARNAALADGLLGLALGRPLQPLDDEEELALHAARVAGALGRRRAVRAN
jgi:CobQ-like glutamine amidotransferase family enzyme/UDP-N-acetylmuramyl tripeptide synthase